MGDGEVINGQNRVSSQLLHNLVLFGRLLRGLGLDVNPGRVIDVVAALRYIELWRKSDFKATLRSLLVHRREDLLRFDEAFELFWRYRRQDWLELDLADLLAELGVVRPQPPVMTPPPLIENRQQLEPDDEDAEDEVQEIIEVTQTYSRLEALRARDFASLSEDELMMIRRFMAQLVWRLGQRLTRRRRPGVGQELDLRRLLRRNLRYGGEILDWPRRELKIRPRPLVILADVSGSMERYTRLLLQFIYGLAEGLEQQVEAFVFSTRLTRVTRQLRGRDLDRALEEVAAAVPDWSGGTRIGEAVRRFNFRWARRVLGQGAVVLLISDGWDRGDPALLGTEIARLQRNCHRLIWLNPLLGSPRYEPLTRGLTAALPFVDDFLPIHNVASLEDLAFHLTYLDRRRPFRRQQIGVSRAAFVRQPA